MVEKRRYKATIAGKSYTIVGTRSELHMNAVTELVNQQLQQLEELAPDLSIADRCVLMAINAVSDQLAKERRIVELEQQLQSKKTEQVPFRRPAK
ncbi:MAG: cell division protein ZapA [Aerococcaceae bacterium]|nr:cell division protein ZapA [Aerococcaceae bacterium]